MYALVEIKGKQYKAEKGKTLRIDKVTDKEKAVLEFDSVLMVSDKDNVKIGTPYLKGVRVKAQVQDHIKDKKIIVYKYKRRKNYRKKQGHRQQYTIITVKDIVGVK